MRFASRRACLWALWARLAIAGLTQEWLDAEVPLLSKTGCLAQCFHGSCTNDFWKHGCKPGQQKTFANLPQTFRERAKKNRNENSKYMMVLDRGLFRTKLIPEQRPRFKEILRDSREDSRDGKEQWTCRHHEIANPFNLKSQVINKTFRKTFRQPSANLPRCRRYA